MPEPIAGNTLFLRSGRVSWADLRERGCPIAAQLASAQVRRLAWVADGQDEAMLAAAAMIACDLSGAILTPDRLTEPLRVRLAETGMPLFRDGQIQVDRAARTGATAEAGLEARIWVLSSGSTGTPKLAEHSWRTLYTARAAQSAPGTIWICPYLPGTYAWYQLVTLGLFGAGQHLVPVDAGDVEEAFARAAMAGANAISSTPTFWRMARLGVAPRTLRSLPLRQITLGGERVDQAILDWLGAQYRQARITHIYASSEAGAAIVVHDRQEGFPASWLGGRAGGGVSLDMREGRLWIRSPHAAIAGADRGNGWIDTGDFLEVKSGRANFAGRAENAFVNVGGAKANVGDVESALLGHPAVLWCKAFGRRAPLVGNLVCAQVVFDPEAGAPPSEQLLTEFCSARLPEYAVPRIWQILDRVPAGESMKSRIAEPAEG